jgi:putative ABC transport system permease protein
MLRPTPAAPGIGGLLLRRTTLRHWRAEPRQTLLLIVILALGVAVYLSVRLANRAAVASFQNFTDTLTGQSDFLIRAPAGDLPESVLAELRAGLGARPVHVIPVVETTAAVPRGPGDAGPRFGRETYRLLGLDLVALSNLPRRGAGRSFFAGGGDQDSRAGFWGRLRGGAQAYVSAELATRDHLEAGGTLRLNLNDQVVALPVGGLIPENPEEPRIPANLVVLDLPALQALIGRPGKLDRVEFLVEPGAGADQVRAELPGLLATLGHGRWTVGSPGSQRAAAETMTRAFRLNLTVLSLIALLVGLYLTLQALDGAVVRRRGEIAILRSLGVEERMIRWAWRREALLLGFTGGVLGIGLGWAGAQAAVRFVGQTVNALYFATSVRSAQLRPGEAGAALVLAMAASLVAGWLPANQAARTPPAQLLGRHASPAGGQPLLRNYGLAAGLVALGVALAWLPPLKLAGGGRFPLAGYAAAFLWIFGGGILCAAGLPAAAALGRPWARRSAELRLALSHLARPSGRHRLAVACLLCSVGMTAGMAILVQSFDATVRGWVTRSFQADLYISSDGAQGAASQNKLPAATWRTLLADPAVADGALLQVFPLELEGRSTMISGTELAKLQAHSRLPWVEPPRDGAIFDPGRNGGLALASESFSARFEVHRGDRVTVVTPAGPRTLTLAGIFADYGNERGSILVERARLAGWFGDDAVNNVSLYLRPGVDPEALRRDWLRRWPGLAVYTNSRLGAEILRIFRQTFSITYALEVIGVVVAVVGLALTLASLLLDRRAELTTLRALGLTPREIARVTSIEGCALTVCAVAGGLGVSGALGWLLIFVINKQSFGWTLGFSLPWGQLALLAATVILTGTAVAHAVGRWGAVLPSDREE